jgi:hypothetical protein
MSLEEVVKAESMKQEQMMVNAMRVDSKKDSQKLYLKNSISFSLCSSTPQFGYKEVYETYMSQFQNKQILNLLELTYK